MGLREFREEGDLALGVGMVVLDSQGLPLSFTQRLLGKPGACDLQQAVIQSSIHFSLTFSFAVI